MPHQRIRVWDLPTRLFHWLLVAAVASLFATAYLPGGPILLHSRLGYAVLVLLLFRLGWGVMGGYWSRFARLVRSSPPDLGHTALGTLSILAMVAVLLVQVGTGLISDDEVGFTGPLNHLVSAADGLRATHWHKQVGQWAIVALVALHIAAIAYYLWIRKTDLVRPMVHGDKSLPVGVDSQTIQASRDDARARLLALALLLAAAAAVWVLVTRLGPSS